MSLVKDISDRAGRELGVAYEGDLGVSVSGLFNGLPAKSVIVLGRRSQGWVNTSSYGDICDYLDTSQSLMNTPTSGQTLYLVSTSVNDTAAGTGIRTVRVVYLDAAGNQQVTTATLNGTTPVSLGSGFSFIQWMEAATVGSTAGAIGNISISSTNGAATVSTTFEYIPIGHCHSKSGRYKIPTGKTGYLHTWSGGAVSTTMDMSLRADIFTDDKTASPGVFHSLDAAYVAASARVVNEYLHWVSVPAGTVVKGAAIPGAANAGNRADVSFHLLVVG